MADEVAVAEDHEVCFGTELGGEGERRAGGEAGGGAGTLHMQCGPGRLEGVGQALGLADDGLGGGIGTDEGEDPLGGRPGAGDAGAAHPVADVGVDMGGGAA